jgi:hypothetical protein
MTPFTGTWTSAEAAHLLRRCTFGATYNDIQTAVQNGLNATLLQLFSPSVVDQPLAYDPAEQIVHHGKHWFLQFLHEINHLISKTYVCA